MRWVRNNAWAWPIVVGVLTAIASTSIWAATTDSELEQLDGRVDKLESRTGDDHDVLIEIRTDVRSMKADLHSLKQRLVPTRGGETP